MVKLRGIKKPLQKGERNRTHSSIEERWDEDAKWFKKDAEKYPEKYKAKNDEKHVSSEELERYLDNFIEEGNASRSAAGTAAHIRAGTGRGLQRKAGKRALTRGRNNRLQTAIRKTSKKK
ncbi:hypothetical protein [Salinicoccus kekensis]|uniref:Uncharacterized protein n=1 Tax=Salinicoccus kekensis TaxID=714307 RepID=A0A285UT54_9STAP|nr:hypothetical protein [Salinicoccus kekensis]SOC43431.1 hypothetical protein SAMN05878391_1978 [Salinicoccus kekensis]